MLQTEFEFAKIDENLKTDLQAFIEKSYYEIKEKIPEYTIFQKAITENYELKSRDILDGQQPEAFIRSILIEPLFNLLGYETTSETTLPSPSGKKQPDYIVRTKKDSKIEFYVEAEHLNCDLYAKKYGIDQINDWLLSRAAITDYGIATDGLKWVLVKFDISSAQTKEIYNVDLKPLYLNLLNDRENMDLLNSIIKQFLYLHINYIDIFIKGYIKIKELEKDEITKNFYSDYVRYVFGYDNKGDKIDGICLIDKIIPYNEETSNINLFSTIIMNRLIFIKFMEEFGIVPRNLLNGLFIEYNNTNIMSTFYEASIKPLFYDVFNKSHSNRVSNVRSNEIYNKIPYLNGGLFREIIKNEKYFNIENEGMELIIKNIIDKYSFGSDSEINPDILGYIFERTINYISGVGTNKQKMNGAYYTPDDVVNFISNKVIDPAIFESMINGLKESGWQKRDLIGYNSIEDILSNLPPNPMHIDSMISSIEKLRIVDPACGSGHFLTAVLSQILRVIEYLMKVKSSDVDRYKLKREIISNNIFGVDIDENAVEIARLRLWLSIINEVQDVDHIDTLPNIDFNIIVGNSLIGWLNESLVMHPLTSLLDYEYVNAALDTLSIHYGPLIEEITELLVKNTLNDTIEAYKKLVSIYHLESGEKAVKIKNLIDRIRTYLYEIINGSYLAKLKELSKIDVNKLNVLSKEIIKRKPFHWKIDFDNVLCNGGFDVVLGNPPYIENNMYDDFDLEIISLEEVELRDRRKIKKGPALYNSRSCGNTHAYFIERSINMVKDSGRFGFIVPVSLVSTDRMSDIRNYIHNNSSKVSYYNFDDRPGKIFGGIEHCRSTIIITKKGYKLESLQTSKYHRWYSINRDSLFDDLTTIDYDIKDKKEIIPKIGTQIEKDILEKIYKKSNNKTIINSIVEDQDELWYYNAPQYWIHAHYANLIPSTEYYETYEEIDDKIVPLKFIEKKISTHYKPLYLSSDNKIIVNGLLNSSLFYWWFVIWSDGRDLLKSHITSFTIDLEEIKSEFICKMSVLVDKLMTDYDLNSNKKINRRAGGHAIIITEIIPQLSKNIIDEIDDLFGEYYNFTQEERSFIKNFDIEFRLNKE